MKKPLVLNFFGAPGTGKSTGAAYVFALLKMAGVNAELVTEYAKDKVWEETVEVFKNQAYIFGKQSFRLSRCRDKVDVIVTDSPLLLSIIYNNEEYLTDNFNNCVLEVFNSYNNLNVLLKRVKKYNPAGRYQTEEESDKLALEIKATLDKYNVEYIEEDGCESGYRAVVEKVLTLLGIQQ